MNYLHLTLLVLAAWRVTHLVNEDEIPFGKLRKWAERRFPNYGWGLGCVFCMSVWIGWIASAVGYWALDFPATPSILLAAGGMSALIIAVAGLLDWLTSAPDHE